ncbi:BgTH12-01155 [Blumeria graminis f. sp. triticale]|uniref:Peroxisomal ATPase PEX6 n=1 Tax=Blumeria graminis f. sp. triticale TaxID=1689686 RepID=A0A9W4DD65_BLUGR|nr:BgTH12-01155 [Blumeria graminis f. sp. triticale]
MAQRILHCRKRRRQDKAALRARLVLDDHINDNIGLLSEDLFTELFQQNIPDSENYVKKDILEPFYVAISSSGSSTAIEDASWCIVPIIPSKNTINSSVKFSSNSTALQSIAKTFHKLAPSNLSGYGRNGIEVRIIDAIPLTLDRVYVSIERDSTKRLENGEGTFYDGHSRINSTSEPLLDSIRRALGTLTIVHTGDLFALPLQPHPITHVFPPPAKVNYCEPVGQGLLSPHTKIILSQSGSRNKSSYFTNSVLIPPIPGRIIEEDEDTSNDQFFSAAEDCNKSDIGVEPSSGLDTETEVSSTENDDFSDDSIENMISLQVPLISTQSTSGLSTVQPGTPRTVIFGGNPDGLNTPGTIVSTFTSNTVRGYNSKGVLFKTQALMRPVEEELIHPKPLVDDDEEARIFVEIRSLPKIGCFSGDWVRVELVTEAEVSAQRTNLYSTEMNKICGNEVAQWRPVKVFGLPEKYSRRPASKISNMRQGCRRTSFFQSQAQITSSPTVYLSPILLANMSHISHCRISSLKQNLQLGRNSMPKITGTSRPPFVRDLALVKISTPFSTERPLQNVQFIGLQRYFANKTRIVKQGDIVAIGIDETLGRTLYQPGTNDDVENDDILRCYNYDDTRPNKLGRPTGVAWFRINYVGNAREADETRNDDSIWGGIASVDASSTRISQLGSENCRLPGSLENPWEYYLGLKNLTSSQNNFISVPKLRDSPASALQRRLRELIAAAMSPYTMHLQASPLAILLVSTQRNIGKSTLAQRAFADMGLHCFIINAYEILSEGDASNDIKTAGLLEARAERAMACGSSYCGLLIRHIEAFSADRMISSLQTIVEGVRILIATTTEVEKIPDMMRGLFTHEIEMIAPDELERENILQDITESQTVPLAPDVDLRSIAVKTAALVAGDLVDLVDRAIVARLERLEKLVSDFSSSSYSITIRDIIVAGGSFGRCLIREDFNVAVDAARKNFADAIGAPKIPNVSWNDVGGLTHVKDAVMETIQLPLERPELFEKGMKKRSGILFYGPPGTGKTLLAKAIATEFSLNFFSVKGPELLNMYIGESEANVRRVFQRARDARPCVVFFDELDSVAPKRGNQGDSGGVMDRIVSQLLAELDGMSDGDDSGGGVFVIGATNRPDLLDGALLRPGRFDKMLYLGVSDTHEKQLTIIEALTRKFTLHPTLSLQNIVTNLPFTYTGADFYALCSDAMLKAVMRQSSLVDAKISEINRIQASSGLPKISTAYFFDHYAKSEDISVMVTEGDFWAAQKELIPSVSIKELENYERVRARFEKVEKKVGSATPDKKGKGKEIISEV